jgi:hypothetical protein
MCDLDALARFYIPHHRSASFAENKNFMHRKRVVKGRHRSVSGKKSARMLDVK